MKLFDFFLGADSLNHVDLLSLDRLLSQVHYRVFLSTFR